MPINVGLHILRHLINAYSLQIGKAIVHLINRFSNFISKIGQFNGAQIYQARNILIYGAMNNILTKN